VGQTDPYHDADEEVECWMSGNKKSRLQIFA